MKTWLNKNFDLFKRYINISLGSILGICIIILTYQVINIAKTNEPSYSITEEKETPKIQIKISGAVSKPGVYKVTSGTLVFDVLAMAEVMETADLKQIDLNYNLTLDTEINIPYKALEIKGESSIASKTDTVQVPELENKKTEFKASELKFINILYLGVPNVFLVGTIYPERRTLSIIQIPPDTRVTIPDVDNYDKINQMYLIGGTPSLLVYIERLLNTQIHYFIIDTKSTFEKWVTTLGGVEVNVTEEMAKWLGVNTGIQKLNGEQSWNFIRFFEPSIMPTYELKPLTSTDPLLFGLSQDKRRVRQREWLQSVYRNALKEDWLTIVKLSKIFVFDMNTNFQLSDILHIAKIIRSESGWQLNLNYLPGEWKTYDYGIYYEPQLDQSRLLVQDALFKTSW